jgi:hypothetical protein
VLSGVLEVLVVGSYRSLIESLPLVFLSLLARCLMPAMEVGTVLRLLMVILRLCKCHPSTTRSPKKAMGMKYEAMKLQCYGVALR